MGKREEEVVGGWWLCVWMSWFDSISIGVERRGGE